MKLNSNLVKGVEIPVSAELIWPRLVRNDIINFPLTYIGNSSVSMMQKSAVGVSHKGALQRFSVQE